MAEKGKIRAWAREHKKGLLIAGGVILLAGTGFILVKTGNARAAKAITKALKGIDFDSMKGAKVIKGIRIGEPFIGGGCVNNMVSNVTVGQLGELGEALMTAYDGLPKDVSAELLVSLIPDL